MPARGHSGDTAGRALAAAEQYLKAIDDGERLAAEDVATRHGIAVESLYSAVKRLRNERGIAGPLAKGRRPSAAARATRQDDGWLVCCASGDRHRFDCAEAEQAQRSAGPFGPLADATPRQPVDRLRRERAA